MAQATVLGGVAAWPAEARFLLSLAGKRLFRHDRFPRLFLGLWGGGFLETLFRLRGLGPAKVVRAARRYHFSLVEPRWPSPAHDLMVARGGLNVTAAGTPAKTQIGLAVLGITRSCPYRCTHCYEQANLGATDMVSVGRWLEVVREMQEIGVGVVALSGGEPLSRPARLLALLEGADKDRSDFHLYTAGPGATPALVDALVRAGLAAAAVGLDDHDPRRHDAFRGQAGAYETAACAIRRFAASGILTYVNTCLTPALVREDGLHRLYLRIHDLGAGAWQLLEPRPCGAFAGRDEKALFSEDDRLRVRTFVRETQRAPRYRRFPAVHYPALMEAPENFGCLMGGLSHLYIDTCGNVEPCVFLPVSFGNVRSESFSAIFRRMRAAVPRPLHGRCPALELPERVDLGEAGGPRPRAYATIREEWSRLFG